jgi:hypothetical protein
VGRRLKETGLSEFSDVATSLSEIEVLTDRSEPAWPT